MEVAALSPDWIQLHGPETPHRVEAIRDEAGIAILKAIAHRQRPRTWRRWPSFADVADRLLLDAKPPKGAERPGGHGVAFDWTLLKALDPGLPFMLSGGLTPETVGAGHHGRPADGGRCLLRGRDGARRQGCEADPGLHRQGARRAQVRSV